VLATDQPTLTSSLAPGTPDQVIASNSSTAPLETLAITGASYSGSSLVLTGTWLTDATRVGSYYYVSGFTGAGVGNNSTNAGFICTAQGANTITLTVVGGYNGSTGSPIAARMFVGTAVDCTASAISAITVFCFSDQNSLLNGMQLQWSQDNTNWQDHLQKTTAVLNESCIISDKVRSRYFRVVYINGSVSQTVFRLQTVTSATNTSGTVRDLDSSVYGDDEAELVRAICAGRQTATGVFTDILTDILGNLNVGFGGIAADAFGRGRVSEPVSLFNAQFQYDNQPLLFQQPCFGTGTCVKTTGETSMTLSTGGTGLGASALCQTKQYFRYQPSKSQQIFMTGMLGAQKSNVRVEIGYYDDNDGLFYRMDGTAGVCVVQRSSVPGISVGAIPAIALVHGTGASYAVGDTGTISTGGANATYQVIAVATGVPTAIALTGAGTGYTTGLGVATATGGAQAGSGTGMTVNIVNESVITQANWNVDTLGAGLLNPSGLTADFTKTQIFSIDFQALYVGRVRFWLVINGIPVVIHQINNANLVTVPYFNTANLPCRAYIVNTGTAGSTTSMKHICTAVSSEGGSERPSSLQFSADNGIATRSASTLGVPILSVQPKKTFNGITNRSSITLNAVDVITDASDNVMWKLVYNGTLGGSPVFNSVDANSGMNVDIAATSISGGHVVASGYIMSGSKITAEAIVLPPNSVPKLPFTLDYSGLVPDTYTLVAYGFTSTPAIAVALTWNEDR